MKLLQRKDKKQGSFADNFCNRSHRRKRSHGVKGGLVLILTQMRIYNWGVVPAMISVIEVWKKYLVVLAAVCGYRAERQAGQALKTFFYSILPWWWLYRTLSQFDQRGSYRKLLRRSWKIHQLCILSSTIQWCIQNIENCGNFGNLIFDSIKIDYFDNNRNRQTGVKIAQWFSISPLNCGCQNT